MTTVQVWEELYYKFLAEFLYNNSIGTSTQQPLFLMLYNYQVNNSPKTADLEHSFGETKIINSFIHNLENLKVYPRSLPN